LLPFQSEPPVYTSPSRIYPTGKNSGEIFNLLELELGSPVEELPIKHNDAVIVATGKDKNVGVRFDLERLEEETVLTTWTVAPEGSSIILP